MTQVTDPASAKVSNTGINTFLKGTAMKLNVGGIDRILRIVLGLVLIGLAATGSVGAWGWIGVVPLATGLIGWCPPYAVFGWSTCAMKNKS